ncbi:hypothetical protein RIF29_41389 [Crotalaria pallida]|uniref:Uncharacterized protein n=1 Tax=Crotalaria pallida TaxID=3830 RepID=A0AAN9EAG4_CROPI
MAYLAYLLFLSLAFFSEARFPPPSGTDPDSRSRLLSSTALGESLPLSNTALNSGSESRLPSDSALDHSSFEQHELSDTTAGLFSEPIRPKSDAALVSDSEQLKPSNAALDSGSAKGTSAGSDGGLKPSNAALNFGSSKGTSAGSDGGLKPSNAALDSGSSKGTSVGSDGAQEDDIDFSQGYRVFLYN